MHLASTVAIMHQKAMPGCLLIALHQGFLLGEQVWYFKQSATFHNKQTNVTVWINDCEKH